jgi:D-proline reductase (dithiol) PrdB
VGDLSEFTPSLRVFLRVYPWRRNDPVPWAELKRPLAEARVALVTSAALVLPGQQAFDETVRGGDPSYRVLPGDLEVSSLRETHRSESFDHAGVQQDPNLGFPLDRLRELVAAGRIGSVAPRHLSFMGSITAPARLVKRSAPTAARLLVADEVDVALLVPV